MARRKTKVGHTALLPQVYRVMGGAIVSFTKWDRWRVVKAGRLR